MLSVLVYVFFFCKQNTAYEMRISDWSSDVCSSDLLGATQLYQCLFRDEQIPFGIEHFKVICDALAVASAGKIGDRSLCRSGTNLRGDLFSKPAAPGKGVRNFAESSLNGAFVFGDGHILTCLSPAQIALPRTPIDPQSVGQGKSVEVSVDIGG